MRIVRARHLVTELNFMGGPAPVRLVAAICQDCRIDPDDRVPYKRIRQGVGRPLGEAQA